MNRFEVAPKNLEEVFFLISQVPFGKEVIRKFYLQSQCGRIEICPYPEEVLQKLFSLPDHKNPSGAFFITDGESGRIFSDLHSELGIVAPFLLHEMVHSMDENLWSAAKLRMDLSERKKIILQSEIQAFQAQHLFQEALKQLFPELREFHQKKYSHVPFLNRKMSVSEIIQLYG